MQEKYEFSSLIIWRSGTEKSRLFPVGIDPALLQITEKVVKVTKHN